jgi:GT2 family glycosyltransferase
MNNKIGVGVVTYNRPEFFKKCIDSIPAVDTLVVVNDGTPYSSDVYPSTVKEVIQHTKNKSVGVSKNELMRALIQDGCDHIFIIEDDIHITDANVFTNYIKTAEVSGLWHLMYGYHGPGNVNPDGSPKPRYVVDYKDTKVALNTHCVGAFCYYLRNVIKQVGYIDEKFFNAWDHLEHSYRITKTGLLPAYWWWPDVANSNEMISDQDPTLQSSVIRKGNADFVRSFHEGAAWFQHKHGIHPVKVPDTPLDQVVSRLKMLKANYARKAL